MRSRRTRARRPAGSATSITSNARPTGSITEAPGNSPQALVTSSSVAPAGTLRREVERVGARRRAVGAAAGAGARRGPRARDHVPAPESGELGDGRALRRAAAPARQPERISRMPPIVKPMPPPTGPARRWLRDERDTVTLRCHSRCASGSWRRLEAPGVVRSASCAPECTAPPTPGRPLSSESRGGDREFIRRGGEWWRFRDRHGWTRDRRITLSARVLGAHALVGMPEASRVPVRRMTTAGRAAVFTGILIRLGALSDKWSQGWGRSSERQRRKRDERGKRNER